MSEDPELFWAGYKMEQVRSLVYFNQVVRLKARLKKAEARLAKCVAATNKADPSTTWLRRIHAAQKLVPAPTKRSRAAPYLSYFFKKQEQDDVDLFQRISKIGDDGKERAGYRAYRDLKNGKIRPEVVVQRQNMKWSE